MSHQMVLARLGVYMRTVASQLRAVEPIDAPQAARVLYVTEKYAVETMARLVKHEIALKVEGGWIRGPKWHQYASRHDWPKETQKLGWEFG